MISPTSPTFTEESAPSASPAVGRTVVRNFGFLAVGRVMTNVCAFVFFALLSRTFGQEGLGQYAFASACAGFFAMGADFGLYDLSIREISRRGTTERVYYSEIFCVRLLLFAAALGLFLVLVPLIPMLWEMRWVAFFLMLQQTTYTLIDGVLGLCIARNDSHIASGCEVVFRLTSAAAGALAIVGGGSFLFVLSTQPVMTFAQLVIVVWIASKRYGSIWPSRPTFNALKETLHTALPFALSGILLQVSSRIDVIVLAALLGSAATGVYSAAYRVVYTLLFVPTLIGLSVFPLAAKLSKTSPEALPTVYNKVLNEILLFGLPVGAGLWLIAPHLIPLLFGPNFTESVVLLRILAWLFVFTSYRSVLEAFLLSCDMQTTRTRSQWHAACISVAATILFTLGIGVAGAAFATLIAEICIVVLYAHALKARLGWPVLDSRIAISVIATSAFFLPLSLHPPDSLILVIGLAVVLYLGTLLLFSEIRRNEGVFVRDTLRRLLGRPLVSDQAVTEM